MTFPISFNKILKLNTSEIGISSEQYIIQKIQEGIRKDKFKILENSENEIILKQKIFYYPDRIRIKIELNKEVINISTTSYTIYGLMTTIFTFLIAYFLSKEIIFSIIGTSWIFYMFFSNSYLTHRRLIDLIKNLTKKI